MSANKIASKINDVPTEETGYLFSVAMLFAQRLEVNFRALLYVTDYHAWGEEMALNERQKERFKTFDLFIDEATLGALQEKLEKSKTIRDKKAWSVLRRACEHRNRLAHSFLSEQEFGSFTPKDHARVLDEIRKMLKDIYEAFLISCDLRRQTEGFADEEHETLAVAMNLLGSPGWQNPNRHYATRKKK